MVRLLALGVVLVALLGAPSASGKAGELYALRYGAKMSLLVPYDPARLVPSGRAIRTGHFAQAWSMSPDRSRFVAAAGWRVTRGQPAALRFVDLASGRVEGTLSLHGEFRRVVATAWVHGRVLAVVAGGDSTTVYSVDPDRRSVVGQVDVPGAVTLGERSRSGVVLLVATPDAIGPATLAVVDQSPRVRTVRLGRITMGTTVNGTAPERLDDNAPTRPRARPGRGERVRVRGRRARGGRQPSHARGSLLAVALPDSDPEAGGGLRPHGGDVARRSRGRLGLRLRSIRLAIRAHRRSSGLVESRARARDGLVPRRRRNGVHAGSAWEGPQDVEALRRYGRALSDRLGQRGLCGRPASLRHLLRHGAEGGSRRARHRARRKAHRSRAPAPRRWSADHRLVPPRPRGSLAAP